MVKENPFLSGEFTSIWKKHFYQGQKSITPNFLSPISFVDHPVLPLKQNVGSTLTKGMSYQINDDETDNINDTFLIYDVPTYFNTKSAITDKLGHLTSKQYPGYLIELHTFANFQDYMQKRFSKSSRYKLNKYKKRLEECFDITYKMYGSELSKSEYETLFASFKTLLQKRFDDKEVYNNNLDTAEWNFYKEVAYPLLLERKAALFVVYDEEKPIGITLNYFSDDIIFDAITVFDIDYTKFHLGSVTIMKLIEWGIEHQFKILDFSKGHFEYKTRWATIKYDFEYHIYYNKKSVMSSATAKTVKFYFDFKQNLREKNLNEKLHKFTYGLKNQKKEKQSQLSYSFTEVHDQIAVEKLQPIFLKSAESEHLQKIAFEFLYLNNERMKNLKIYRSDQNEIDYFFVGDQKQKGVKLL